MKTERVVEIVCKCGRIMKYGNGGHKTFSKNGKIRCFDCEMKKFRKLLLTKNADK